MSKSSINLLNSILQMEKQCKDSEYTKYVRGKSVCIVGPSTDILGKRLGGMIENHDIIVRHNSALAKYPFNDELEADIGKRIDVLYMSLDLLTDEMMQKVDILENVWFRHVRPYNELLRKKAELLRTKISSSSTRNKFDNCIHIQLQIHRLLQGISPTTGFVSIIENLISGARVHVEGFSFYHSGGNMFREQKIISKGKVSCHNLTSELKMLYSIKQMKEFEDKLFLSKMIDDIYSEIRDSE
jgi:hypothetical protein